MVKHYKQIKKSKKNNRKTNSRTNSRTKSRKMKGGDGSGGRVALPPSYYGKGLDGYYASGSPELNSSGKQLAVSQGTIVGNYAGPNLFPMSGGDCGCKKQRKSKNRKSKNRKK